MAIYTSESQVRAKFQLLDTTLVPSSLVTTSIGDAHAEILRRLDMIYDRGSPEEGLALGETLLAGAHLLRSLASSEAFAQKRMTIGGQRIEEGSRFASLMRIAADAEARAWEALEPYLEAAPARTPADATATTPVLGEE